MVLVRFVFRMVMKAARLVTGRGAPQPAAG